LWEQAFDTGIPRGPVAKIRPLSAGESTGTTITFKPDFTIIQASYFEHNRVERRCKEVAYQVSGLTVILRDERNTEPQKQVFYAKDGLLSLVKDICAYRDIYPTHSPIHAQREITVSPRKHKAQTPFLLGVEFAIQYTNGDLPAEISFVNTVETVDGGTHMRALQRGIVRGINKHRDAETPPFKYSELRQGLIALISIRHPEPRFESPTKVKITNSEILEAISRVVTKEMDEFAVQYTDKMKLMVANGIEYREWHKWSRRTARR
jgi:DNA gyrase subunit B